MNSISIRRKHGLSPEAARAIAEEVIANLAKEYDAETRWDGDTLHFERTGANGTMRLKGDSIRIEIKLGMMFVMMRNAIQREIEKELDQRIAAAKDED